MKKILSIMASGAVIAAFAGVAAATDLNTGTGMMKQVDEQQEKVIDKKEDSKGKAGDTIKKKDKAKKSAKQKKEKMKKMKASKAKPTEKITEATEEGDKGVQEMKDMKKELY